MSIRSLHIFIWLSLISVQVSAGRGSDSLRAIIYSDQADTLRVQAANAMSVKYEFRNPDTCLFYAKKALSIANKLEDAEHQMISHYSMGLGHYMFKEYETCIEHCERALELSHAIKDTAYEGLILYKLSRAYSKIARYDLTIQAQLDAIRYYEKINYPIGVAVMNNNMSIAYKYLGDHREAIGALRTAIKNYYLHGDSTFLFTPNINIGDNYLQLKQYDSARIYLDSAIYFATKHNADEPYLADYIHYWIGEIHYNKGEYDLAYLSYEKSHAVRLEHYDIDDQTYTYLGLGKTLVKLKKYRQALPYLKQALQNAKQARARKRIMMSHIELSELYYNSNDFKNSSFHLREHMALKDSIFNDEKAMAIMSARTKFDVENKDREIKMLNMKSDIAEKNEKLKDVELQQTKSRQLLLYLVIGFALLAIGALFFIIKKRNQTNRLLSEQKDKIEQSNVELSEQKQIVEAKNKEILDSITYAKRIQSAILPPDKLVKEYLQESFILYKPKDIVAGDFYWMETIKNKVLFAAADCTGHGVPGAMVSVVCNNGLNRSVREYGLTDPGKILDKTREIVVEEFEKSEEEVKDGMDIALCTLEGKKLEYAGAHNPLWIIRKGCDAVEEIKANKQPIGKYDHQEPYTSHKVDLNTGDTIYIFSDGFADQFGGEKGKKFKTANFKQLLLSIQSDNLQTQKDKIDKHFENWRGNLEQLDDVCVIGVRIA